MKVKIGVLRETEEYGISETSVFKYFWPKTQFRFGNVSWVSVLVELMWWEGNVMILCRQGPLDRLTRCTNTNANKAQNGIVAVCQVLEK